MHGLTRGLRGLGTWSALAGLSLALGTGTAAFDAGAQVPTPSDPPTSTTDLGGSGEEAAQRIALDPAGNAYVSGPVLGINNVSKAEGNSGTSAATFKVSLSPASTGTVTVKYATANRTAVAGSDYIAASGTLTFAPGQTSKTVAVWVRGDMAVEPNETFFVNLSAPTGATLFDSQGLGTILNDDGPVLRITDVSKAEGNTGTSAATFKVSLSPASTGTVTVKYASANGTALAGSDYTAVGGTLTFVPGQTSKTVTVPVTGDTLVEPNETFFVNLSAPTGATLFDSQGLGTILNDDGPVLRITDVSKAEGNSGTSAATLKVSLSPASTGTVTVKYASANGTALAGSDYTAVGGTLTFAAGQTSKTVTVKVTGDTLVEPNETFFVNLSAPTGATLFDSQGLGTILNDDGPVLRINNVSKAEGNAGTSAAVFTVTLSPDSTGTVTLKYATANGTAVAGSDYTAASGTLTFAPGQPSETVAVDVIGDTVAEPNETFVVNLSAASGATLFDSQGLGTILNDDEPLLGRLNDTGITTCSNGTTNGLACPVVGYPGQDAESGRDVSHNDDGDGHAGFSFTKLAANGGGLPASAPSWACVRDNVTGLIWEVKTDDGGLRDQDNTYSWYNPDPATNGGSAGYRDWGACTGGIDCDTDGYVQGVNAQGLCGASDWRMPSRRELMSIVSNDRFDPAIDWAYFPNTPSYWFWSSSPDAYGSNYAWGVHFGNGSVGNYNKDYADYIRLVRGGQ